MAIQLPLETSRGTESLFADAAITFAYALVKSGSDDRHFAATANVADIPRGVVLHDTVSSDDVSAGIKKTVALLGVYPETLPVIASAAIGVGALVVPDPANPGQVKQLPTAAGTYFVIGRARFAVTTAGDPVSLAHCLPYAVTIPATGTANLIPDAAIAFANAVVKIGSDDSHVAVPAGITEVPRGVLLSAATSGEVSAGTAKSVAVFGEYPGDIPAVAAGAIPASSQVIAAYTGSDKGKVLALPAPAVSATTYLVIGRSRTTVANVGDPVSIIHQVPVAVTVPAAG